MFQVERSLTLSINAARRKFGEARQSRDNDAGLGSRPISIDSISKKMCGRYPVTRKEWGGMCSIKTADFSLGRIFRASCDACLCVSSRGVEDEDEDLDLALVSDTITWEKVDTRNVPACDVCLFYLAPVPIGTLSTEMEGVTGDIGKVPWCCPSSDRNATTKASEKSEGNDETNLDRWASCESDETGPEMGWIFGGSLESSPCPAILFLD